MLRVSSLLAVGIATSSPWSLVAQEPLSPASLRAHVAYLASDELRGRGAGTEGYEAASRYVARLFLASRVLAPPLASAGSDSTFLQPFQVQATRVAPSYASHNVIALIPGTDPVLRETYVTLGAHLDGQGIRPGTNGSTGGIHNSANDNATGSAIAADLAVAIGRSPPKRSVLVMLWGAEEVGAKGSRWFVEHPPFPLDKIVAHVNLDGVGRFDRSPENQAKIFAIGGALLCPALHQALLSANASSGSLVFDTSDPNNWFQASDHIWFHRAGIPSVFLTDLGSPDYHRTTDDADRIDYDRLARVGQTALTLVRQLADADPWICQS